MRMIDEAVARAVPTKGDRFIWGIDGGFDVSVVVRRVARDLAWADILCVDASGASWTKRQRLPLPAGCRPVKP